MAEVTTTALEGMLDLAARVAPKQRACVYIPQEVPRSDNLHLGPGYLIMDLNVVLASISHGFDRYHYIATENLHVARYCSLLWEGNLEQVANVLDSSDAINEHLDPVLVSLLIEAHHLSERAGIGYWASLPLNTDVVSLHHHRSFKIMAWGSGNDDEANAKQIIKLKGRPKTEEAAMDGEFLASCQPATLLPILETAVNMVARVSQERRAAIRRMIIREYDSDQFTSIKYADGVLWIP